ncbi:hemolysin family protein [Risungbinella massiliensis]|uniref:hemolysin family protein n=1 Tax=Risungbinella massiliensis TaxID=1329796 RepID=UPI000A74F2B6|nr:hemolysin family protein [Risungbinella massiliensis]
MESDELLSMFLQLLVIFLLVLLNGFFVASEHAIGRVRSTRIAQLTDEGNQQAQSTQKIISNLEPYLSATQLGITLSSLVLGWFGERVVAKLIGPIWTLIPTPTSVHYLISFGIAFSLVTILHIVLGEIVPKSLAIRNPEATSLWISKPLHLFSVLFRPAIWLINYFSNRVLRIMGIKIQSDHQQAHTEKEIRMLVEQSHKSGMIDQVELALFDNIFDFSNRVGREVMVPRINMSCIFLDDTMEEILTSIKGSKFTRFPLCGEDKDHILGIIHTRDFFKKILDGEIPNLQQIARPAVHVPETMEIQDILKILQSNHTEMAIVVDEYGGTSGLVTMEDIIEEIVGEIQDEFDDERPFVEHVGNLISIDARLLLKEVNEQLQIEILDENNDTLGGWFFSQFQEVPQINDVIYFDSYCFHVSEMKQNSVTRIIAEKLPNQNTLSTENKDLFLSKAIPSSG